MTPPRIVSLCSGYGGLDMAAEAVTGGRTVAFAEYDPDPSRILAHHWPDVPNLHDVKAVDWPTLGHVDVLTAGYPCQPFSHAGKRGGEDDPRHLWPAVLAGVRALRPRLVLLENVSGHLSLGFGRVLGDLAEAGYDAEWVCLRAADVGAPHGRARLFIAATDTACVGRGERRPEPARRCRGPETLVSGAVAPDTDGVVLDGRGESRRRRGQPADRSDAPADPDGAGLEGHGRFHSTPGEGEAATHDRDHWGVYGPAVRRWERVTGRPAPRPTDPGRAGRERLSPRFVEWMMGLPDGHVTAVPGLSRNAQLKALGNGVVPQQAAAAYRLLLAGGAT